MEKDLQLAVWFITLKITIQTMLQCMPYQCQHPMLLKVFQIIRLIMKAAMKKNFNTLYYLKINVVASYLVVTMEVRVGNHRQCKH